MVQYKWNNYAARLYYRDCVYYCTLIVAYNIISLVRLPSLDDDMWKHGCVHSLYFVVMMLWLHFVRTITNPQRRTHAPTEQSCTTIAPCSSGAAVTV